MRGGHRGDSVFPTVKEDYKNKKRMDDDDE